MRAFRQHPRTLDSHALYVHATKAQDITSPVPSACRFRSSAAIGPLRLRNFRMSQLVTDPRRQRPRPKPPIPPASAQLDPARPPPAYTRGADRRQIRRSRSRLQQGARNDYTFRQSVRRRQTISPRITNKAQRRLPAGHRHRLFRRQGPPAPSTSSLPPKTRSTPAASPCPRQTLTTSPTACPSSSPRPTSCPSTTSSISASQTVDEIPTYVFDCKTQASSSKASATSRARSGSTSRSSRSSSSMASPSPMTICSTATRT